MDADSDEEIYESFTGTPDMTVYYEGEIADNLNIVMSLSFYEKKTKGTVCHKSAKEDRFQIIGTEKSTPDGIQITLTEYNADNHAIGRFVGILDGKEYYGKYTYLSTCEESNFSLEIIPFDQSLDEDDGIGLESEDEEDE